MIHIEYTRTDQPEATNTVYATTPLDAVFMMNLIGSATNLRESGHGGPIAECEQVAALRNLNR